MATKWCLLRQLWGPCINKAMSHFVYLQDSVFFLTMGRPEPEVVMFWCLLRQPWSPYNIEAMSQFIFQELPHPMLWRGVTRFQEEFVHPIFSTCRKTIMARSILSSTSGFMNPHSEESNEIILCTITGSVPGQLDKCIHSYGWNQEL